MILNPPPWPDGARCAVAFTFDMDADSILHLNHHDTADTRIATMSALRYGPEVAVPRIVNLYKEVREMEEDDYIKKADSYINKIMYDGKLGEISRQAALADRTADRRLITLILNPNTISALKARASDDVPTDDD